MQMEAGFLNKRALCFMPKKGLKKEYTFSSSKILFMTKKAYSSYKHRAK